jgi:hypothetical protein
MSTLQIRDFPEDLKRQLDIERAYAGTTIRQFVIDAVRCEVDRQHAQRERREQRDR